jgi:predicted Zn-dependent peptidase
MQNWKEYTLKNGLRVFIFHFPYLKSTWVQVNVRAGRAFETPETNGVSHFLEHVAFGGSQKYPDKEILRDEIRSLGGYLNARTGAEYTEFKIKIIDQYFEKACEILYEMTQRPLLSEVIINEERKIITEELHRSRDISNRYTTTWLLPSMVLKNEMLGLDTLGTETSLNKINQKLLKQYFSKFYNPRNMILMVCSSKNEKQLLPIINKHFGQAKDGEEQDKNLTNRKKLAKIKIEKKLLSQVHVGFGLLTPGYISPSKNEINIWSQVWRYIIYNLIREKHNLAYAPIFDWIRYENEGAILCNIGTSKEGVKKVIEDIFESIDLMKNNITDNFIQRGKNTFISNNLFLEERAERFGKYITLQKFYKKKITTLEEENKICKKMTKADFYKLSNKYLSESSLKFAFLGDINSKLEKEIRKML